MADADLETLVELAKAPSLESLDKAVLSAAADAFESQTPYGSRWQAKADLIERLAGTSLPEGILVGGCDTIVRNYIYLTKELGVKDVGRLVQLFPQVFGLADANIKQRVAYLRELGVADIGKLVQTFPHVFGYSNENVEQRVKYLRKLGVKDIGKLVQLFPHVFGYSNKNIEQRVAYLRNLGVTNVGKLVQLFPRVFGYSNKNIEQRVAYLRNLGVTNVGKLVQLFPRVFGYSNKNIEQKVNFYALEGFDISAIEKFPAAVSYSLEKRIKPRFAFLESLHYDLGGTTLSAILIPNDVTFSKRFAGNERAYGEFKQNYLAPKPQD